jgi:hydrogenase-4 component B
LGLQTVIFLVALVGFGLKAGMMPLHFWLPGAHASAPTHVSAMLSGVLLKIGIYGLLRINMLLSDLPLACGILVLTLGVISAVLGVAFALGQHDLKRLLAYHSIENIGIILIGLGLAMLGMATHTTELVVLGLAGCLLHVWNHSLFKSLLFLAAGSVVHAAHTREIDHLGGLAKQMPRTAAFFCLGAIAICGLPPLNGFVSEFIIYLGLFRAVSQAQTSLSIAALAAPALAMVGALAVACFVKAYGAVFLGTARTEKTVDAHESTLAMVAPMALLAAICVVIGVFPFLVLPLLDRVIALWPGFNGPRLAGLVPHAWVTTQAALIILAVGIGVLVLRRRCRIAPSRAAVTWDCGYLLPRSSIQYTSSSFASSLVGLFRWVLRPVTHLKSPAGLFPVRSAFGSHVPDAVLDGLLHPVWGRIKLKLASFKSLQQGRVQQYLAYVLLALFGLLLAMVPVSDLIRRLLAR